MSKLIDLSRGYDSLSEKDKLYLAARGKLPKDHISDGIATALNLSGAASNVAYGAHTGTVATMTDDELEKELERRRATADKAFDKGDGDPQKALMPDLDNPHSERLEDIQSNHERFAKEGNIKHAASQALAQGPVHPSLGAPGSTQRSEVGVTTGGPHDLDDDEDEDDDEGLSPEDYADAETPTTKKELTAEILRRNEQREEAGLEPLSFDGNKAHLVSELQRDDEERGEEE